MGFETLTMRIADRLREHGPVARYGLAVAAVMVASALTASALPLLSRSIFVFYVAAVVATAWAGGLGPALLATALSVLAADYLFIAPLGSFRSASVADLFAFAMFAAVSVLVSSLSGALTAGRRRAEAQATTLREQGDRLEEQAEALEQQVAETRATAEALERANEDLQATMIVADATRAAAERAERRVTAILSSISDAFVAYDRNWRFVYANERARTLFRDFGRVDDPVGRVLWDTFPQIVGTQTERELRRAMEQQVPVEFESFAAVLGTWHEVRIYPWPDGISVVWRDVTARRQTEETFHFLAEVNAALSASLDYEATLGSLARLAVPQLADWCAVSTLEPDGSIRQLALAHVEPAKVELARELERRYPTDPHAPTGVPNVLRTGKAELLAEIPDELLVAGTRDAEHLRAARELGLKSGMIVPLTARGRTLGALTLVSAESGRRYGPADLALAEELGRRAGLAVDNARLYREAERANRAKAEFLAVMSHELRTPLNAIGGYAQLMEMGVRGSLTDEQREDLRRIQRSQKHLLSLINDVLNFAKLEAGHVRLEIAPVRLAETLGDLDVLIEPQVRARGLRYERHVAAPTDHGAPLTVLADREKLQQVVLNLLANAVKFTPPGGKISVSCEPAPASDYVAVRVTDTGRGIPPDKLEAIFEPFVQVGRGTTGSGDGTGLGLAISRDLARAMGGDLVAESTPGAGSTFTLLLPRAEPGAA